MLLFGRHGSMFSKQEWRVSSQGAKERKVPYRLPEGKAASITD